MPDTEVFGLGVFSLGDAARIVATGAGVDALYRAFLAAYGPTDGATRTVFSNIGCGRHEEDVDGTDCLSVANALFEAGMRGHARTLYQIEARCRADELRDEAASIEAEADHIERVAGQW